MKIIQLKVFTQKAEIIIKDLKDDIFFLEEKVEGLEMDLNHSRMEAQDYLSMHVRNEAVAITFYD